MLRTNNPSLWSDQDEFASLLRRDIGRLTYQRESMLAALKTIRRMTDDEKVRRLADLVIRLNEEN